jgi:hypothetical protein
MINLKSKQSESDEFNKPPLMGLTTIMEVINHHLYHYNNIIYHARQFM